MIIDSHAHIFPHLGSRAGFPSVEAHLDEIQRSMHNHLAQPVKRKSDHQSVSEKTLWDPDDPTMAGKYEVNFRVTNNGRFEWKKDGIDYYIHYMPPNLQTMEAGPEFLKVMMEYVGIDKAVLQCASVYGKLNYYYLNVIHEYGDLFYPLYQPEEMRAYSDEQIMQLRDFVKFGFRAIWFAGSEKCFTAKYRPFWDEVSALKLPVFWSFHPNQYTDLSRGLLDWVHRYPNIINIIAQSFPMSLIRVDGRFALPDFMREFTQLDNVLFELAYPISEGNQEDYPYPRSQEAVKFLYNIFGAHKLVWGSDIPNVERYCTYAQSLNYLRNYCSFVNKSDMDLILGGNLAPIFEGGNIHE